MKKIALLVLPLLLSGCVQTKVTGPNGLTFSTTRFAWNGKIGAATFTDTNGVSMSISGYQSDAAELAKAVADGVVSGLMKGAAAAAK